MFCNVTEKIVSMHDYRKIVAIIEITMKLYMMTIVSLAKTSMVRFAVPQNRCVQGSMPANFFTYIDFAS